MACMDDGIINVWPAPAIPKLYEPDSPIKISSYDEPWITTLALISLGIGSIFTIYGAKYLGNKNIVLLSCIPVIVSWLMIIFAENVLLIHIARFVAGFCDAMCYVAVPAYIGEIAEPAFRGILSTLIMASFNFGVIITYYGGYALPLRVYPLVVLPVPILVFVIFLFMPNSPSYLISIGKPDEARRQLEAIRNISVEKNEKDGNFYDIDKEFSEIKENIESSLKSPTSFFDLFRVEVNRKAVFMVLLTVFIWQCSGFIFMSMYLHTVVLAAKINVHEMIPVLAYAIVQWLSCLASTIIVDRYGRKPLMYASCVGSAVCLGALGLFFYLKQLNYDLDDVTMLPIVALMLYIFFSSIGLGVIPVVYSSELFAYNIQNYGCSILCISFAVFGLVSNTLFPIIGDNWGFHIVFWMFSVMTMIGTYWTYKFLPETRNKSRMEIQQMLLGQCKEAEEVTKC